MILIADSGSTKTDWRIIHENDAITQVSTTGLNPFFISADEIGAYLIENLLPKIELPIRKIYFYGAGCSTGQAKATIRTGLSHVFSEASIEVYDDMLAAARAACNHEEGIVCILGTGSNSCLYKEGKIVQTSPSNGIWFGDEGSAGYMGKMLIQAYLNQELPEELVRKFEKKYDQRRADILENVYSKPHPNRYLASFSRFVFHHMNHPFIYKLVYEGFQTFFRKTVCKYPDYQRYPVHCVGSVGFYYANVLRKVANELQIPLKNILESPIAGLTLFHQEEYRQQLAKKKKAE
ncbi:N-acetylglucosamine kinase [Rapidithrix thailandica]|uniref:N-acetylglucosamine kinase n=1 Tax=Rapidithrix thailandica TaxID=413964 RepID=A0AAW9RP45_9BACT